MNILSNINSINNTNSGMPQTNNAAIKKATEQKVNLEYKPDVLDILSEKVVNKNDLNDMVTTPRAIFKGYLCFTTGTAINAISALIKNDKVKKGLAIAGSLISVYGTYNFVKPYLIKGDLTKSEK